MRQHDDRRGAAPAPATRRRRPQATPAKPATTPPTTVNRRWVEGSPKGEAIHGGCAMRARHLVSLCVVVAFVVLLQPSVASATTPAGTGKRGLHGDDDRRQRFGGRGGKETWPRTTFTERQNPLSPLLGACPHDQRHDTAIDASDPDAFWNSSRTTSQHGPLGRPTTQQHLGLRRHLRRTTSTPSPTPSPV